MSDFSINLTDPKKFQKQEAPQQNVETGGVIASNTPSPLFNAAPSVETGGSIASSGTSSSGGGTSFVC